jgi:pimeloyl-ACP methyl ester carboxylesterase
VLVCHPAPGCSGFDPDPGVTQHSTLGFITLDRPGYASSDPWEVPPQPSPVRWSLDAEDYLTRSRADAESIGRHAYRGLAVLGWREGCVYAAALAARLGEQASAVVFVEPMTLGAARESLHTDDPWDVRRLMPDTASDTIVGLHSRVERMLTAAAEQGDAGLEGDRAAMKQQVLDESLRSVRAPALILARNTRRMRRSAHAYARRLPVARVAVTDAAVPIAAHWGRIVAHLEDALR